VKKPHRHEKRPARKPQDARNRKPTTHDTRRKCAQITQDRATDTAARLLQVAERQARKGSPRLIAEIFRFLRPNKPIILQVKPPRRRRHH
jgi:hypothetical protein